MPSMKQRERWEQYRKRSCVPVVRASPTASGQAVGSCGAEEVSLLCAVAPQGWGWRAGGGGGAARHRPASQRPTGVKEVAAWAPQGRREGTYGGGDSLGCAEAAMEVPVAQICNVDTLHPPHRRAAVECGYAVEEAAAPPIDSRVGDSGRQGLVLPHFEDAARDGLPAGVRLSPLWLRTCQLTLSNCPYSWKELQVICYPGPQHGLQAASASSLHTHALRVSPRGHATTTYVDNYYNNVMNITYFYYC
jgi:hypothetical protein